MPANTHSILPPPPAPPATAWSKLSDTQIQCLRARYRDGAELTNLAAEFDLDPSAVRRLVRGVIKERPLSTADIRRFWSKVDQSGGPSACWLWRGGQSKGRGQFAAAETTYQAHRLAYILTYGPIPERHVVIQECGNLLCVNPQHVFVDLPAPVEKRGEAHALARLSNADAVAIRERYAAGGITHQALADSYKVTETTIRKILRGLRYTDAGGPRTQAQAPHREPMPWQEAILSELTHGMTVKAACEHVGITIMQLRGALRRDTGFARRWSEIRSRPPRWYSPFLTALRQGATVTQACLRAEVDPRTVYDARRRHETFRVAWEKALETGSHTRGPAHSKSDVPLATPASAVQPSTPIPAPGPMPAAPAQPEPAAAALRPVAARPDPVRQPHYPPTASGPLPRRRPAPAATPARPMPAAAPATAPVRAMPAAAPSTPAARPMPAAAPAAAPVRAMPAAAPSATLAASSATPPAPARAGRAIPVELSSASRRSEAIHISLEPGYTLCGVRCPDEPAPQDLAFLPQRDCQRCAHELYHHRLVCASCAQPLRQIAADGRCLACARKDRAPGS